MSCKYVILYDPQFNVFPREGEKEIKRAIAVLLPSKTKNDQQAVRRFQKLLPDLEKRAQGGHLINLCKIIR